MIHVINLAYNQGSMSPYFNLMQR